MASSFKILTQDDTATTKTLLHEAIPITGTVISGTYNDENIKNFSHGMFQAVYDYPYLSSSANHIFDISFGYAADSALTSSSNSQNSAKIRMYTSLAQSLMGFNSDGDVLQFDADGDLSGGTKHKEVVFLTFARLTVKDEIKKGSFSMSVLTGGTYAAPDGPATLTDASAINSFYNNAAVGEYGLIKSGSTNVGLLFYQAGVAVLTSSVFSSGFYSSSVGGEQTIGEALTGSTITNLSDGLRRRITNIQFVNTTELNSKIYFLRINPQDFRYSSNPSFTSGSKIVTKQSSNDTNVTYITRGGLYAADGAMLASFSLSEPLAHKDDSLTLRVRLDY